MSKRKYRIFLIGLGNIAIGYDLAGGKDEVFTHTKACLLHPQCEVVGGCDPDPLRREAFTNYTKKPAFKDLKSAGLVKGSIDIFII